MQTTYILLHKNTQNIDVFLNGEGFDVWFWTLIHAVQNWIFAFVVDFKKVGV